MSFATSNRVLAIGLSIGIIAAYVSISTLLREVKDAAKAPPAPDPPTPAKNLQKDSENSLKIETLRTLADGYSYDLRNSAIKIVASRTARSKARDLLLRDLASKNHQRRENAIDALILLLTYNSLGASVTDQFRDGKSATAVVKALINVLPQHDANGKAAAQPQPAGSEEKTPLPSSPIRPDRRPAQEGPLLLLLGNMLGNRSRRPGLNLPFMVMDAALQAGLVTKWLANYPFPCSLPENAEFNYKRSDVARLFDRTAWVSDDPMMEEIIFAIMQNPTGSKQMRQVGLSASRVRENVNVGRWTILPNGDSVIRDDIDDDDEDVRMVNGEDTAGLIPVLDDITSWDEPIGRPTTRAEARLRSAERSPEEEHLRRRHREAIVVAERGAPLRRENILQREDSRFLQPMNGVSDVQGELNGLLGLSENNDDDNTRSEIADDHTSSYNAAEDEDVLDPVAEAEIDREMRALEEEVEAEALEMDRAQRRHRQMEESIGEDPQIQGMPQ